MKWGGPDWETVAASLDVEPTASEQLAQSRLGLTASPQQRSVLLPAGAMGPGVDSGKWKKPPVRGESELLAAYCTSPGFRAVVNRVASSFGSVPFYRANGDERDYQHPGIRLLNRYNAMMLGSQGRELEQVYLDITGDAITVIAPVAGDTRMELYPVPSTWVTMETTAGLPVYHIKLGKKTYTFGAESILHQREINPLDPYGRGRGPGWAAGDEVTADEAIAKHVGAYYFNSTRPEFIGILKGANPEQLKAFSQDWDNKHRGFRKAWRPGWFSQDIEIKELTAKLDGQAIRELRDSHLEMIQWLYGVPPEVLGRVTNSNRATIKEAKEMMGTYVLDPRCRRRQAVWQDLMDRAFDGALIEYVSPIPREFDRRDEIMSRHSWAFTRNEIRREAGLSDVRDGDIYAVPANLTEVPASRAVEHAGRKTVVLEIIDGGAPAQLVHDEEEVG